MGLGLKKTVCVGVLLAVAVTTACGNERGKGANRTASAVDSFEYKPSPVVDGRKVTGPAASPKSQGTAEQSKDFEYKPNPKYFPEGNRNKGGK